MKGRISGGKPLRQWLEIIGYGLMLAGAAFVLTWLERGHASLLIATEFYIVLIALAFAVLGIWIGRRLTGPVSRLPESSDTQRKALGITEREAMVLTLLARGQSNKEIAREMEISPNTVKTHLARLYEKLGVNRRTQALRRAQELSLIR